MVTFLHILILVQVVIGVLLLVLLGFLFVCFLTHFFFIPKQWCCIKASSFSASSNVFFCSKICNKREETWQSLSFMLHPAYNTDTGNNPKVIRRLRQYIMHAPIFEMSSSEWCSTLLVYVSSGTNHCSVDFGVLAAAYDLHRKHSAVNLGAHNAFQKKNLNNSSKGFQEHPSMPGHPPSSLMSTGDAL